MCFLRWTAIRYGIGWIVLGDDFHRQFSKESAARAGYARCEVCGKVSHMSAQRCPRCRSVLHLREPQSIQTTLALLITATILYVPANLLPMMTTTKLGQSVTSSIMGGVMIFLDEGSYLIAGIIFFASIVIPTIKIIVLFWLCYCATRARRFSYTQLTQIYRVTEFIGKWSMVDVFVVAILVALVHITGIVYVTAGWAAMTFAMVVIITMLAAQKFDMRLIWDRLRED